MLWTLSAFCLCELKPFGERKKAEGGANEADFGGGVEPGSRCPEMFRGEGLVDTGKALVGLTLGLPVAVPIAQLAAGDSISAIGMSNGEGGGGRARGVKPVDAMSAAAQGGNSEQSNGGVTTVVGGGGGGGVVVVVVVVTASSSSSSSGRGTEMSLAG